jgi:hypothetical protein
MKLSAFIRSIVLSDKSRGLAARAASALLMIGTASLFASAQSPSYSPKVHTYKETILHSFTNTPDGEYPTAGLLMDDKGNLYGATEGGGTLQGGQYFNWIPPAPRRFSTTFQSIQKAPPPCPWERS